MSTDPATMQAMLTQRMLQQPQGTGTATVGTPQQAAPTSPLGAGAGAASQLAQKIMLMRALQGQRPGQPPVQAQPNPMAPAIPQQPPLTPGVPGG